MALEVVSVDEQAGYTQIVTQRGTEGWIRSQYLVSQPIAKIRLQQAQRQLAKAQEDLRKLQEERQTLRTTNQSQANENEQRESRIQALESELEEIKRVSADALATHNENQRLNQTNVRLQDELDDLSEAYTRLEDNAQNEAILIGAGLILLGLLAGVIIKARPQRSAWS